MTTEADDRRELELLRLANAELDAKCKLQAAQVEHLTGVNEHLAEQCDRYRAGANNAIVVAAKTAAEFGTALERLTAENAELRARVADNTTPAIVLADVEELTTRDSSDREHWLNTAGAFGFDPTDIAERDRKPRLRAVPRQGGRPC